jgi:hypothetical protein
MNRGQEVLLSVMLPLLTGIQKRAARACIGTPSVREGRHRPLARQVFDQRLAVCSPRVERLGIPCTALAMRSMRTPWGNCSRSGLITLNPRLVQIPMDCIDYVLLHA